MRYVLIAMITCGIIKDYTMTTTFEKIVMQVRRKLHLLTPGCRVLLEKLTGLQLVKKFPAFLWNPKVHYRTHKRPPPVPNLGQPSQVHIPTSHLLEIQGENYTIIVFLSSHKVSF